ncbi:flavodoxin family protein [Dehalogenimonas sp. THU2]|uniref:flavodoxin family protein n=1 Tax=Dehalogenimonas sp. THU2 TaxID=3151121 RepID=UPI003218C1F1
MNVLVVYDSCYGNTEAVARAIGESISARVLRASEASRDDVRTCDLLIVGSPTQGGRPTKPLQAFIDEIPDSALGGITVATFDTRFSTKWVKMFGYAAERIAASLQDKGAKLKSPPACFFVNSEKGPLKDGELKRAGEWAKELTGVI